MIIALTTAPVWVGAYHIISANLKKLGICDGCAPLSLVCEPPSPVATSVDDKDEMDKTHRRNQIAFYREVADQLVTLAGDTSSEQIDDREQPQRLPRCLLVFLDESSHGTRESRCTLLTHVRAFFHRSTPSLRSSNPVCSAVLDFIWLQPAWCCESWGPSVTRTVCAPRPAWLGGWMHGGFVLTEQLLRAVPRSDEGALRSCFWRAKAVVESVTTDLTPYDERLTCDLGPLPTSADGWSAALTVQFSPFWLLSGFDDGCDGACSPIGTSLFVVLREREDDSGSSAPIDPVELLTHLHVTQCYLVLVALEGTRWRDHNLVSSLLQCGVSFTVAELSPAAPHCATPEQFSDDSSVADSDGIVRQWTHSTFAISALASLTVHFLTTAAGQFPSACNKKGHPLWRWLDSLRPAPNLSGGPFELVGSGGLGEVEVADSKCRGAVPLFSLPSLTSGGSDVQEKDVRGTSVEGGASTLRSLRAPKEWTRAWARRLDDVVERVDLPFRDKSLFLLGQSVSYSVFVSASPPPAGRPSPVETAILLLLSTALGIVTKDLMDKGRLWRATFSGPLNLTFEGQREGNGASAPLVFAKLAWGTPSMEAILVLWGGNIASASCSCGTTHRPTQCVHVAALCIECCNTVLHFTEVVPSPRPMQHEECEANTTSARTGADRTVLPNASTTSSALLGPDGVPRFMTDRRSSASTRSRGTGRTAVKRGRQIAVPLSERKGGDEIVLEEEPTARDCTTEFHRENPEWYVGENGEWRCEWDE